MSDLGTTQKLSNLADETDAFVKELNKKIRNKQKKLDQIQQLEKKIQAKEIVANEEQKGKIASKSGVLAEINEVKTYLDLYKASTAISTQKASQIAKQHEKELQQAKTFTVKQIVNALTIKIISQCGQSIPDEFDEGVKHFNECLDKLTCRNQGQIQWRQERDTLITELQKLVTASKETITHTDITYDDFSTAVSDSISSNIFPETITCNSVKKSSNVPAVVEEEEKVVEEVEEVVEEVIEKVAKVEETPVEEEQEEKPQASSKYVELDEAEERSEPANEVAQEADPAIVAEEESQNQEVSKGNKHFERKTRERGSDNVRIRGRGRGGEDGYVQRGRGGGDDYVPRGRGGGDDYVPRGRGRDDYVPRGRGEYRGRGRGEYRGRGGRGEGRGGRGGRGGFHQNGMDAEGFTVVKEDGDNFKRGRGRGRGYAPRGDGGEYRGRGEYRGGRGEFRGGRPDREDRGTFEGKARVDQRPSRGGRPKGPREPLVEGQDGERVEETKTETPAE